MTTSEDERAAPDATFEEALRLSWQMISPTSRPNAGSYARGEYEGIVAALKTVRSNFEIVRARTHTARAPLPEPVLIEAIDDVIDLLDYADMAPALHAAVKALQLARFTTLRAAISTQERPRSAMGDQGEKS
jgi:hypothetical protein